jgi:hypothetical protein
MKAIIANTIATAPKPIFVKGVTFLLRSDDFLSLLLLLLLSSWLNPRRIIVRCLLFTNWRVRRT